MALNLYNVKKWFNMLRGKSIQHVNQGLGTCFSIDSIKGYYNDLTEKVSDLQLLDSNGIPLFEAENRNTIYFPIMIFQYGLGAYDLYLKDSNTAMLEKTLKCAEWTLQNQEESGAWRNFENEFPDTPYSSMAQGEAISLLLRAYIETKDEKYKQGAVKAVEFMIKSVDNGGTARFVDDKVYFQEFTHLSTVLNGWIFSLFGIYDYLLVVDDEKVKGVYNASVATLEGSLADYDCKYWSNYNLSGSITSPFYHKLHIAQLQAMYELTGNEKFKLYADKWSKYQKNFINKTRAFIKKAWQKVFE